MAVKGHVDGFIGAYITGWALADPDHANCAIQITDSTGELVAKGRASRHRADLAVLGLGRTSFAYRIPIHSPPDRRLIRVEADGVELDGSPVETGAGVFDSDCAVVGGCVVGWITERVTGFAPPLITVFNQHGAQVGESLALLDAAEPDPFCAKAHFAVELAAICYGAGALRLTIFANGLKFSERDCVLELVGNLESVSAEAASGWLLSPDQPRAFEIDVYRDGVLAGSTVCDISREDVRAQYPKAAAPGFSVTLPRIPHDVLEATTISLRLPGSDAELFDGPYVIGGRPAAVAAAQRVARLAHQGFGGVGAAERAVIQLALSAFIATARGGGGGFTAAKQPDAMLPRAALGLAPRPRLVIIIPVYRGVAVTAACIQSVLAHREPLTDQLVLVNDASPDKDMAAMLNQFAAAPNVYLMTNEQNLGFVQTVNRGLGFAAHADVLLLNSDTVLYPGGLDELCRVAYATPEIGTVTAMSNNATIFSYPHAALRKEVLSDIGWSELAAAALVANAGVTVEVPTGHGFCMLIKGEVLRRVGILSTEFGRGYGEENDLCQRAADLGYRHVAAAGVIVEHRESISFVDEKASLLAANLPLLNKLYPELTPLIMEFERQDGMRRARWALDRLRLRRAAAAGAGFVLIIANTHDGGTVKAIEDIKRAGDDFGAATELNLRVRTDGFMELLCERPELNAVFAPGEIEPLFDILSSAAPGRVFVHQLLGYPAAFIEHLATWAADLHAVYYLHDFYPICPRVTMIDAVGRFCDVADTGTCARCVGMGGAHETSKLTELTPAAHRELFGELLHALRHVVAPSANAGAYLRRVFPELTVTAVPHPEMTEVGAVRTGNDDEVVMLGAIGPHKGSHKLLEIAQRARLTHPHLHFRVIGYTDIDRQLTTIGNVTVTGRYKPDQLPRLIGQARGRLALFLPAWPETYSYTLSEAAQYGFIPLVPDIGAPAARVRQADYGVVFPFPANAEQVLALIEDIRTGRIAAVGAGAGPERLFPTADDLTITRRILGIEAVPDAPLLAPAYALHA